MAFISLEINFFEKKVLLNFAFLFVYWLLTFINETSSNTNELRTRASFGRINKSISLFHFIIKGFHLFGNIFSKKKQVLLNFAFLFVYLLLSFINERSHNTLSVFTECAIKHFLRAKL